uniref:Ig-like domain-containing protein n=1 Tax=Macrostomum lignano TaxID=282301 RepID=A0A1I8IAR0_9PLAT
MCPERHLEAMGDGAIICFMVRSCELVGEDGPHLPSCCISCDGPNRQDLRPLRSSNASEGMIEAHYSLEAKHTHHNQKLKCRNGRAVVEKTLGIIGDPADVSLSVSPVWVTGHRPLHTCEVNFTNGQFKNMTPVAITQRPTKSLLNRTVVTVTTYYETVAGSSVQRAAIRCTAIIQNQFIKKTPKDYVTKVSKPCRTDIYLGYFTGPTGTDEQSRRIHVTSHECSIWGVSHCCWLVDSGSGEIKEALDKIKRLDARQELADSLQRKTSPASNIRLLKLARYSLNCPPTKAPRQRSQDFSGPKKSGWKVKRPKKSVTLPPRVRPPSMPGANDCPYDNDENYQTLSTGDETQPSRQKCPLSGADSGEYLRMESRIAIGGPSASGRQRAATVMTASTAVKYIHSRKH